MFSLSTSRPNRAAAKRSFGRSLSGLGLFACILVVAGAGCGGGTDYSNDGNNGGGGGVVTPVETGNAPFATVTGTRGTIPIAVYPNQLTTTLPSQYFLIGPSITRRLNVPTTSFIGVPTLYADRKFDHFELNGVSLGGGTGPSGLIENTTLSLAAQTPTVDGTLRAVYVPYNPGAGVPFTPNYNQANYCRFDSMPVKVYLDPSITPNDGVRQRIIAGMDKWVNATGGVISYTLVTSESTSDISFFTADTLAPFNPSGGETLAIAVPEVEGFHASGLRRLKKSNVYGVASRFNAPNAADQLQFEQVIAHEFGHALGIFSDTAEKHHSPNPQDLMYPAVNNIIGEITANDVGTIANIYRAEFDAAASRSR